MKDKTVNIPIFQTDILNTIDSLPRTPKAAGIIPINFKRKLNYKNNHMAQYISVPKVLKALKTLKALGNPYYQFIPISDNFDDKCKENDLEGFQFIYPEDEIIQEEIENRINEDGESEKTEDTEIIVETEEIQAIDETESAGPEKIEETELDVLDKEEANYQKNDSVKKWQFE